VWYSLGELQRGVDSVPLLKYAVAVRRVDTIAFLYVPPREFIPAGATAFNLTLAYAPQDRWGLLPNGSVWIARGQSNRIDWIDATGRLSKGVPRPFATIRTTEADRHRLDGLPTPLILDTIKRSMATSKAPFQHVVASADGELWFWLNQPAGYRQELYEIVGVNGSVIARVTTPNARRLIAVGATSLYFFGEDSTGEFVVTRHARPRFGR
jgi:hypothetical protein